MLIYGIGDRERDRRLMRDGRLGDLLSSPVNKLNRKRYVAYQNIDIKKCITQLVTFKVYAYKEIYIEISILILNSY